MPKRLVLSALIVAVGLSLRSPGAAGRRSPWTRSSRPRRPRSRPSSSPSGATSTPTPSSSMQEKRTAGIVAAWFERLGLEVRTGIGGTGVLGILRGGKPGPVVMMRGDMDALPITEETPVPFASKETGRRRRPGMRRDARLRPRHPHDPPPRDGLGPGPLPEGPRAAPSSSSPSRPRRSRTAARRP